jgi:hypothetical protein
MMKSYELELSTVRNLDWDIGPVVVYPVPYIEGVIKCFIKTFGAKVSVNAAELSGFNL